MKKKISEMTLICRGFTIPMLSEKQNKWKKHETEVDSFVIFIFIMEYQKKRKYEKKTPYGRQCNSVVLNRIA